MSNVLFENVLLTSSYSQLSSYFEWECSYLITDNTPVSIMSLDFFLSYLSYFNFSAVTNNYLDNLVDNSLLLAAGTTLSALTTSQNVWYHVVLTQFNFSNFFSIIGLYDVTATLLNYHVFFNFSYLNFFFFENVIMSTLYYDFFLLVKNYYILSAVSGSSLTTVTLQIKWFFELIYSFDVLLICVELLTLIFLLNLTLPITKSFKSSIRIFYDDIVTFCQMGNLSVTEIGVFFSFCLGFILFDVFMCSVDEDVTDVFSYFMLVFVFLLFFFLILGIDIQYFYMVSNISGGDLTTRVVVFDVINNFLCVLRIFFCWVRYIFYDLQVELVDFSFHYTDSINDLNLFIFFDNFQTNWNNNTHSNINQYSLLSSLRVSFWLLIFYFLDISFIIFQILLSFVKLFIAFFLLWLIVDLFVLKAFALSESSYFNKIRVISSNWIKKN